MKKSDLVLGKEYMTKPDNIKAFYVGDNTNGSPIFELSERKQYDGVPIAKYEGIKSIASGVAWCFNGLENQFHEII